MVRFYLGYLSNGEIAMIMKSIGVSHPFRGLCYDEAGHRTKFDDIKDDVYHWMIDVNEDNQWQLFASTSDMCFGEMQYLFTANPVISVFPDGTYIQALPTSSYYLDNMVHLHSELGMDISATILKVIKIMSNSDKDNSIKLELMQEYDLEDLEIDKLTGSLVASTSEGTSTFLRTII